MKTKKTILIVEDERILRETIHLGLEKEEFTVIEAKDGEEGLLISLKEHPDLILLDLIMPKMDGMTMLKKLRDTDDWGKTVPIIILTNLTSSDEQRNKDVVELTPVYYLEKTQMDIDQIIEKINGILL